MSERRLPDSLTAPGLVPCCRDCERELRRGEPRIVVYGRWYRCAECEYALERRRLELGRAAGR